MKQVKELYIKKHIDVQFLFLAGAMIGWIYEVILRFFQENVLVNRGMLHGPWLPIYGIGCILMVGLKKWKGDKPISYFGVCFIASAVLEYATSWLLEMIYHTRWWDYGDLFLNLNGRIYLKGLLGFALGGCLLAYVVLPVMEKLYHRIPYNIKNLSVHVLTVVFILDMCLSILFPNMGAGVTR